MADKIITHPQNNRYAKEWERIFGCKHDDLRPTSNLSAYPDEDTCFCPDCNKMLTTDEVNEVIMRHRYERRIGRRKRGWLLSENNKEFIKDYEKRIYQKTNRKSAPGRNN